MHAEFGERANVLAVHIGRGHRLLPLEDVAPQLRNFVTRYARLPFPVAFGLSGAVAARWQTEGAPHTLVFAAGGSCSEAVFEESWVARKLPRPA
ncbi:hypothetical protein [Deinococcus altitudinis]|uniref:hypothetical protein n=1 Tax=Deinococcus altitudinis TaxID=468914 RepID=UPI0038919A18